MNLHMSITPFERNVPFSRFLRWGPRRVWFFDTHVLSIPRSVRALGRNVIIEFRLGFAALSSEWRASKPVLECSC